MRSFRRVRRRAVSLLEMLIAIAIITTLASMLLSALGGMTSRARGARCMANLRQIAVAMNLYVSDNDGLFPPQTDANGKDWDELLQNLMVGRPESKQELYLCQGQSPKVRYGYNNLISGTNSGAPSFDIADTPYRRVINIVNPAKKVLVGCVSKGRSIAPGVPGGNNSMALVHGKRGMLLFADGHVAACFNTDVTYNGNFEPGK